MAKLAANRLGGCLRRCESYTKSWGRFDELACDVIYGQNFERANSKFTMFFKDYSTVAYVCKAKNFVYNFCSPLL
jgi:hypothetical protein